MRKKKLVFLIFSVLVLLLACSPGMADNSLATPGAVWTVVEAGPSATYYGVWVVRDDGKTLDASWSDGAITDVLEIESIEDDEITLYRQGIDGYYYGYISPDGLDIYGTASWYDAESAWEASITPGQTASGPEANPLPPAQTETSDTSSSASPSDDNQNSSDTEEHGVYVLTNVVTEPMEEIKTDCSDAGASVTTDSVSWVNVIDSCAEYRKAGSDAKWSQPPNKLVPGEYFEITGTMKGYWEGDVGVGSGSSIGIDPWGWREGYVEMCSYDPVDYWISGSTPARYSKNEVTLTETKQIRAPLCNEEGCYPEVHLVIGNNGGFVTYDYTYQE